MEASEIIDKKKNDSMSALVFLQELFFLFYI